MSFILRVALVMILSLSIITFFVFSIRFGSASDGVSAIAFLSPVIIGVTLYALGGYLLYRLARLVITWLHTKHSTSPPCGACNLAPADLPEELANRGEVAGRGRISKAESLVQG